MITDSARYRDGHRLAGPGPATPDDGFVWIGLVEPGEAEFAQVGAVAGLPAELVAQALRALRVPGVTRYPQALLVVLPTAERPMTGHQTSDGAGGVAGEVLPGELAAGGVVAGGVVTGRLLVLVGASFVLTVRHGPAGPMRGLRARLEQQPRLLAQGPPAVLHAICAATADGCLAGLAAAPGSRVLRVVARQLLGPLRELAEGPLPALRATAERLAAAARIEPPPPGGGPAPDGEPGAAPGARQVPDDGLGAPVPDGPGAARVPDGGQPGGELRRLSAWGTLAVPPLLLGGYAVAGQGSSVPYGYPLAIGATALICGTLHRIFKRGGWL